MGAVVRVLGSSKRPSSRGACRFDICGPDDIRHPDTLELSPACVCARAGLVSRGVARLRDRALENLDQAICSCL